jgi:hypothetical protein
LHLIFPLHHSAKGLITLLSLTPAGDENEWILQLSIVLVAHLHIVLGLSQTKSNTTLVALKSILHSFKNQNTSEIHQKALSNFPIDIQTAINWLDINPSIFCTLCCPQCFKIYYPKVKLTMCDHQETPPSHPCHAPLFNIQNQPIQ